MYHAVTAGLAVDDFCNTNVRDELPSESLTAALTLLNANVRDEAADTPLITEADVFLSSEIARDDAAEIALIPPDDREILTFRPRRGQLGNVIVLIAYEYAKTAPCISLARCLRCCFSFFC